MCYPCFISFSAVPVPSIDDLPTNVAVAMDKKHQNFVFSLNEADDRYHVTDQLHRSLFTTVPFSNRLLMTTKMMNILNHEVSAQTDYTGGLTVDPLAILSQLVCLNIINKKTYISVRDLVIRDLFVDDGSDAKTEILKDSNGEDVRCCPAMFNMDPFTASSRNPELRQFISAIIDATDNPATYSCLHVFINSIFIKERRRHSAVFTESHHAQYLSKGSVTSLKKQIEAKDNEIAALKGVIEFYSELDKLKSFVEQRLPTVHQRIEEGLDHVYHHRQRYLPYDDRHSRRRRR
jgi:hypothetical protein